MYVLVENYLRGLEEDGLLTEAPFGPQTLGKYGLKAGTIDEATFTRLQEAAKAFPTAKQGQVIRQLGRLAVAEPKQVEELVSSAERLARIANANLDVLVQATNATALRHAVDAAEGKTTQNELRSDFNIESTPADWENERYKVYKAHSEDACIRYGKGYSFCISKSHGGNMYHTYRKDRGMAFYFVFDRSLPAENEQYISVVGMLPDGKCEVTHKSNQTEQSSKSYGYSLDKFLATKPGLEGARALFVSVPQTAEERARYKFHEKVGDGEIDYKTLTPEQQLTYVNHNEGLDDAWYAHSNAATRMAFINRGRLLTSGMAEVSSEGEKRRSAKLYYEHGSNVFGVDFWVWDYLTPELLAAFIKSGRAIPDDVYAQLTPEMQPLALSGLRRIPATAFATLTPEQRMDYLRKDPMLDQATVDLFTPEERDHAIRWSDSLEDFRNNIQTTLTPEELTILGRRMLGMHLHDEAYGKEFGSLPRGTLANKQHAAAADAGMSYYGAQQRRQLNESVRQDGVDALGRRADGSSASRPQRITRWAQLAGVKR